jgi:hypothetical protein
MPRTNDATANQFARIFGERNRDLDLEALSIAQDQEAYVRAVYERCPRWRWRKKRKLAVSLAHTERVRLAIADMPSLEEAA